MSAAAVPCSPEGMRRLAMSDGAVKPFALDALFAGLADATGLILAVSGGPDSMALMLLAAHWASHAASVPIHVASIDHGLRATSRAEAESVGRVAKDFGLPHAILTWDGPKPSSRIQERARVARYALLADHARLIGASHILTGHHADDQAETVLMRLGRGSGLAGLAGMRRATPLAPGVTLLRPLLEMPKRDLVALCRTVGLAFVDDPSNADPAFARARLRAGTAARAALGLDTGGLTRLARRMAQADAALDAEATRIEAGLAVTREAEGIRISLAPLAAAPFEILLRILRRIIEKVAPGATIRLERLESLTLAVASGLREAMPHRATLGGTRLSLGRDAMMKVTLEGPRRRGGRRDGVKTGGQGN